MDPWPRWTVGTSGYSFDDWVGTFYPAGTQKKDMLERYVEHFNAVEVNFTYYRMPTLRTMESMARRTPEGFVFWVKAPGQITHEAWRDGKGRVVTSVKANQETTHKFNRGVAGEFIENIAPLTEAGKLAGVLLQFPQSFHRTVANRTYLAGALADFAPLPLAVEFRHGSWAHPAAAEGLRQRHITLVVPDVPDIRDLYHSPAAATTSTGYLRLHSRAAGKWYAGAAERYDYDYSETELRKIIRQWSELDEPLGQIFAFFNNCHHGQAAQNAEAFRRLLEEM